MALLHSMLTTSLEWCEKIVFDFIIVGSGAAGVASALTLADKKCNILILEAGPMVLMDHVGSLPLRHHPGILKQLAQQNSHTNVWCHPNRENEVSYEQTWSLAGGRTVFWGGHTPRFLAEDFEAWPISMAQMEASYQWAEQQLGVNQNFFANPTQNYVIQSCQTKGLAVEASPLALEAKAQQPSTLPRLFASSMHQLLASPYYSVEPHPAGIHLCCDALAQMLQYHHNQIVGLEVWDRTTAKKVILQAKRYLLAGGALQSTQLVMNSNLPVPSIVLGKSIGEHLFIKGLIELDAPLTEPVYLHFLPASDRNFMFEVQGPFEQTWYEADYATIWLDWKANQPYLLLYGFGIADILAENEILPASNPCDPRYYKVHYQRSRSDQRTFEQMQEYAELISRTLGGHVRRIEIQAPGSSLHERGGLVMGIDSKTSLVNPAGQFWNFDNLYCMDSATWPSQGAANSCLTIMANAHRQCQFL